MSLTPRSLKHLEGVHDDLVRVVHRAAELSEVPFVITDGVRTLAEQKALKAAGASQTLNSRHLTGHAVDVAATVNGKIRWDWPLYPRIAAAFKQAAKELETPIVWGGEWKMKDGPHFELDRRKYP